MTIAASNQIYAGGPLHVVRKRLGAAGPPLPAVPLPVVPTGGHAYSTRSSAGGRSADLSKIGKSFSGSPCHGSAHS